MEFVIVILVYDFLLLSCCIVIECCVKRLESVFFLFLCVM